MRYAIACRQLGGECDFVATGATPTEVKRAVWGHVRQDHGGLALTPGMRAELDGQMDGILGDQTHKASPPFPLSLRERGNEGRVPSPISRDGEGEGEGEGDRG